MVPVGWNPWDGYNYNLTMNNNMSTGVGAEGASSAFASGMKGISGADGEERVKPVLNPGQSDKVQPGKKSSPAECETCKERKYQDGSEESNVSFQTAQHVSPSAAGAAVRAHEGQHVSNAYKKAAKDGGKVLQASVAIHTAICPECGRTYVSGGTTTTRIKYGNEKNPYVQNMKNADRGLLSGMNIDARA